MSSLKLTLEALIMSSHEPLSLQAMVKAFDDVEKPTHDDMLVALRELEQDYADRSIELKCLPRGYCFQTRSIFASRIVKLNAEKPPKFSQAFLEILAIIAYRQPVTRGDIEEIRGVSVNSGIIKALLEREWIQIIGQRDVPGKPSVYGTTKTFLDYFNLTSLKDLPPRAVQNE